MGRNGILCCEIVNFTFTFTFNFDLVILYGKWEPQFYLANLDLRVNFEGEKKWNAKNTRLTFYLEINHKYT